MLFRKIFCKNQETGIPDSNQEEPQPALVDDPLHQGEKAQFLELIKQTEASFTKEQRKIMDIFLQVPGHVSAEYINKHLAAHGKQQDMNMVTGTLELFCRYGFAQKHRFNGSGTLYEHLHLGTHHDHLLCTQCGKVIEFCNPELENLQQNVVDNHGFTALHHRLEIKGICPECREKRDQTYPLTAAAQGERLMIIGLGHDRESTARLRSMGLNQNDCIEVICANEMVIIAKKASRLALAGSIAKQVMVAPRPD